MNRSENNSPSFNTDASSGLSEPNVHPGKVCSVCSEPFSLVRRKHLCKHCRNPVCKNHSAKRQSQDAGLLRICDHCEYTLAKQEISDEIQDEMSQMKAEIAKMTEKNSRLTREQIEKTSYINRLEQDLKSAEKQYETEETQLKQQLAAEQVSGENISRELESKRKATEKSSKNEKVLIIERNETENSLESLKLSIMDLQQQYDLMNKKIGNLTEKIATSLPIDRLIQHLCAGCKHKVKSAYDARISSHSAIGGDQDSFLADHRSVLLALEEIAKNAHSDKEDCVII